MDSKEIDIKEIDRSDVQEIVLVEESKESVLKES